MKISLTWLKDYVAIGVSPEKLAERLTMAGLEVEKIASIGKDKVFELEITPNRPDCLNYLGIAREVAAILGKSRTLPKMQKGVFPKKKCSIEIKDKQGCPRYIGTLVENVRVGKTPLPMKQRLEAMGLRTINNVVDITNFCLLETGQPLHAFDYDKLIGGKIVVRRARQGEKIVTIDEVERELDPSILVIADAKRPVAIAGIMGGKETEVTTATRNILLESAYFDPVLIRRASRKIGLTSDSSYRFERGVDFDMVEKGADRAIALILKQSQGKVTQRADVVETRKKKISRRISISLEKINSFLGASLSMRLCQGILKKLDFKVLKGKKDNLLIMPPSFRADVQSDVDVVEEISRIIGYDNLPLSLPLIKATEISSSPRRDSRGQIRKILSAQGFNEIITYSMSNQRDLEKSKQDALQGIKIQNPLTQDQEMMRPALLPSMLHVVRFNLNRGQKDIRFFETGKIYSSSGEKETVSLLVSGSRYADWRILKKENLDYYDLKGSVESLLQSRGIKGVKFETAEKSFFVPGFCASMKVNNKALGFLGKVDAEVLDRWDIKQDQVFFAQLDLEEVYNAGTVKKKYVPVVEYPCVVRDISLAVKKDIAFQEVQKIALTHGGEILQSIKFVEEYLGEKIPSDHRGIIFSLNYQSSRKTLTEEEVNAVHDRICQALVDQFQAIKR